MSAKIFAENYEHGNLDRWQDFVDNSTFCNIFQTKQWAKAIQEAGLKTLLIAARAQRGEIIGGMLATYSAYNFACIFLWIGL